MKTASLSWLARPPQILGWEGEDGRFHMWLEL